MPSWAIWIQFTPLTPYFYKILLFLFLSLTGSPKFCVPFKFPDLKLVYISHSACILRALPIILNFITLQYLVKSVNYNAPHFVIFFHFKIFSRAPCYPTPWITLAERYIPMWINRYNFNFHCFNLQVFM